MATLPRIVNQGMITAQLLGGYVSMQGGFLNTKSAISIVSPEHRIPIGMIVAHLMSFSPLLGSSYGSYFPAHVLCPSRHPSFFANIFG